MAGLLKNPRFVNSTASLFVFAISLATYLRCLEPSVSWWDCGEFIAASYGMEVGHPPGAPLFLLLGRIFTLLAPDPGKAAMMVNVLSALASALTVFFLYHTIVMLVGKAGREGNPSDAPPSRIAVIAGLAGALASATFVPFKYATKPLSYFNRNNSLVTTEASSRLNSIRE